MKYLALHATIRELEKGSEEFQKIASFVLDSEIGNKNVVIDRIYSVTREKERDAFAANPVKTNHRLLFHGSRVSNFVGLLSRGILMPKVCKA